MKTSSDAGERLVFEEEFGEEEGERDRGECASIWGGVELVSCGIGIRPSTAVCGIHRRNPRILRMRLYASRSFLCVCNVFHPCKSGRGGEGNSSHETVATKKR